MKQRSDPQVFIKSKATPGANESRGFSIVKTHIISFRAHRRMIE